MISEPFAIGESMIHRLDPRIRLSLTVLYAFVVALSYQFTVLVLALGFSSILILISRLRVQEVLKRLVIVNALIMLLWLLLPFTFKGEVLTHFGSLAIYRPGVILAAQITLKSNAILLAFIALIATMSFSTLGHAMYRLRIPEKIVSLLMMTYRYIFVIEEEYQRLMCAAKIRGFRPGTNANTYRAYSHVIGMLFVRAAVRAERVHQAMRWVFAAMMMAVIVGLIIMEWLKST